MKLFSSLNSPQREPKAWRLLPLALPVAAKSRKASPAYNAVWVGTQTTPYSIVINARKTPRDIYDD